MSEQGIRINLRVSAVLVCICFLYACGFHLRSEYQLPESMRVVYIQSSAGQNQLVRLLRRELKSSGAEISGDAARATATIRLMPETRDRQVLSVDRSGQVREYRLQYSLIFSVNSQEKSLQEKSLRLENSVINLSRVLLYNPVGVLGSSVEADRLYEYMQRDAVRLMMQRIQASGKSKP